MRMFFLLVSLPICGAGIALYLGDHDGTHWLQRGVAAGLVMLALGMLEFAQRRDRDSVLSGFGVIYALIFLAMAAYSLYLNVII